MKHFILAAALSSILLIVVASCGGGGGGGGGSSSIQPATGELSVEPPTSEVGEQIGVSVKISNVTTNLAVKVRVPQALIYEAGSSRVLDGDKSFLIEPTSNVALPLTESSSSSTSSTSAKGTPIPTPVPEVPKRMLVFYVPAATFTDAPNGELKFLLRAVDLLPSGKVELDIDIDNPEITNTDEFSPENPLFGAEDAISIRVRN